MKKIFTLIIVALCAISVNAQGSYIIAEVKLSLLGKRLLVLQVLNSHLQQIHTQLERKS
jgi:hypothetical protein